MSEWKELLASSELEEGRVRTVRCGRRSLCVTRHGGKVGVLDNRCPHQGGPLGEGSIENGLLRCPWHGWDYDPLTGKAPGFDDGVETFEAEERDDAIHVRIEAPPAPAETVSDLMVRTMTAWGVRHVFGMVGHSNLGLAAALQRAEERGDLRYVGIRHEGAASFAASAYGKLTGRAAACLSIAGPGATNLLTGLWDAHVDRSPVLALTGQVNTQVLGPGAFQEIDLRAAFGGVAQWTQPVLSTSRHTDLVDLACKSALTRRGVSHLIFPDEVQTLEAPADARPGGPAGRLPKMAIAPSAEVVDEAAALLAKSRRPVVIVGHGARADMPAIVAFAESLDAPLITTFKAKGLVPDDHPLACGVLGRSGTPVASYFMNEADALIVLGASFSDHTGITSKKPTIQVDFDPQALAKFHAVDVLVWGSVGESVRAIGERVQPSAERLDPRAELRERWAIWRAEKARRARDLGPRGISAAAVFDLLGEAVDEDAILAVDVGNNTYSFGRYFECRRQSVLMSGYLGSIGFSFPAAMGAWAATQEEGTPFEGRQVVSISGDGGFGQYMSELTTAVKYGMNITHVLLDNGELGKISKEQRSAEHDVWQTSLVNPDFAALAELCGARGWRAETVEQARDALSAALAHPGPSLVALVTDPELL